MNNKATRIIGVVILVIILALAGYYYNRNYRVSHPTKTVAEQGKAISGFPQDLIMYPNGAVETSYSLNYGTTQQYTATFNTTKVMSLEWLIYRDYLNHNGYYIANQNVNEATNLANLYGTKDNIDVNIVIQRRADKKSSDVTISYVVKGK